MNVGQRVRTTQSHGGSTVAIPRGTEGQVIRVLDDGSVWLAIKSRSKLYGWTVRVPADKLEALEP